MDLRLSIACNYCSRTVATMFASPDSDSETNVDNKLVAPPKNMSKRGSARSSDRNKSRRANVVSASPTDEPCKCLKPRARCSLCLARLNTPSTLQLFRGKTELDAFGGIKLSSYDTSLTTENSNPVIVKNPFASFSVFCATCRHSGHASHYLDWFKAHNHCPVSGCTCQCSSLDKMIRRESIIHQN